VRRAVRRLTVVGGAALLLPGFAAAFLGSTQLLPGKFNIWGTLIAIFVLATGVYGLELVSGAPWLNDMFNGVALIVAVALSINRGSSRPRWLRPRRGSSALAPVRSSLGQPGDSEHGPESSLEDSHVAHDEPPASETGTDTM